MSDDCKPISDGEMDALRRDHERWQHTGGFTLSSADFTALDVRMRASEAALAKVTADLSLARLHASQDQAHLTEDIGRMAFARDDAIRERDEARAELAEEQRTQNEAIDALAEALDDAAHKGHAEIAAERDAALAKLAEAEKRVAHAFDIQNRRVQRAKDYYGGRADRLEATLAFIREEADIMPHDEARIYLAINRALAADAEKGTTP